MRVIVTGSRKWTNEAAIERELRGLPPGTVIVHGNAHGADALAGTIARRLGFSVEAHTADWKRLGRAAGILRNQSMLELGADLVLAFPHPDSIGTYDMIERARKAGIAVRIADPLTTDPNVQMGPLSASTATRPGEPIRWQDEVGQMHHECVVFCKVHDRWGELSNMHNGFPIELGTLRVKSTEALYQSLRFPHQPEWQREVLAAPHAMRKNGG